MSTDDIGTVRTALQRFQDGYTRRDLAAVDDFMDLFGPDNGLEVIGTGGVRPSTDEWYLDRTGVRKLVEGDWEGWGDLVLDIPGARIQRRGDVVWLATAGTVSASYEAMGSYQRYLDSLPALISAEGQTAEEKLLDILRGASNTVYELRRGEKFVWPLRLTAVLVRDAERWLFSQIHFSFPTLRYPDARDV